MPTLLCAFCFAAFPSAPTLEPFRSAAHPTIPPPYVSDVKLAHSPVVVVGRWNGTPLTAHKRVEGNVVKEFEGRTELVIERVIKGDVKAGEHKILLFRSSVGKKMAGS